MTHAAAESVENDAGDDTRMDRRLAVYSAVMIFPRRPVAERQEIVEEADGMIVWGHGVEVWREESDLFSLHLWLSPVGHRLPPCNRLV